MDSPHFPLNVWFRLSPKFRVWYAAVALLVVLLVVVVYAPVGLLADVPFLVTITVAALTVVVLALFLDAGDPGFRIPPFFSAPACCRFIYFRKCRTNKPKLPW